MSSATDRNPLTIVGFSRRPVEFGTLSMEMGYRNNEVQARKGRKLKPDMSEKN